MPHKSRSPTPCPDSPGPWPPAHMDSSSATGLRSNDHYAFAIQQAIRARDEHTESLLRCTTIAPLPPAHPHFLHQHPPYLATLPSLRAADASAWQQRATTRWLSTALYSLAGATASLAQSILARLEQAERRKREPHTNPAAPDAGDHQAQAKTKQTQTEEDDERDLHLATCAEHTRHIARTTQQLMAVLSAHLDACEATPAPVGTDIEEAC